MARVVTTKEMKGHPWITIKSVDGATGEETERTINLKKFLDRYTSIAEDYMHNGKYSVIGKFYDKIIWTFTIPTAATDGVRLFFNPIFVKEVTDKGGEAAKAAAMELQKKGIDWRNKNNEAKFDVHFEVAKYFIFIIMHECYHMIYRHVEQSKRKKETATGGKYIHWLANTSMDIEINRDIEKQWPEFEGCTVATEGWFKPEYGNKVWTVIFDERFAAKEQPKEGEQFIPPSQEDDDDQQQQGQGGGMDMPEEQMEAAQDYVDGWKKAIEDYKNGLIDLDNFKPLAVDKSKFGHKMYGESMTFSYRNNMLVEYDRGTDDAPDDDRPVPSAAPSSAPANANVNVDEWNQGYNDCIAAIIKSAKQQGGAGGKGGLKVTNLPQPPSLAKPQNNQQQQQGDGQGSGDGSSDQDQQGSDQQGQGGGQSSGQQQNGKQQNGKIGQGGQQGDKNQDGQNGNNTSPIKKSSDLGDEKSGKNGSSSGQGQNKSVQQDGDDQQGQGSGQNGDKSGKNGQNQQDGNGAGQNGQQQQGQNGQGNDQNGNQNGSGRQGGSQQQQGAGGGQNGQQQGQNGQDKDANGQKSGDGSQNGQGKDSQGDGEEDIPVYRVSKGRDWGSGDLISVQEGLDIMKQEGELTDNDINTTPEEHAKKVLKQVKDKLKDVGKSAGRGLCMADRLAEIEAALAPPVIKWKALLLRHFKELGVKPDTDSKMKRSRFGIDRADRFEKIEDFKVEELRRMSADIFYLVDASGSIGDRELQIVFRELIGLETRTGLDIRKAAFTYFSDDFLEDRIRLWYRDTAPKEKMKLVKYVSGKDPGGGTNISGSVNHVVNLKKSKNRHLRNLYSTSNPQTLIIVFTDGCEGGSYATIGALPQKIRKKIIFVVMNTESDSWGFKSVVPQIIKDAQIPEKNVICIDTEKDLAK